MAYLLLDEIRAIRASGRQFGTLLAPSSQGAVLSLFNLPIPHVFFTVRRSLAESLRGTFLSGRGCPIHSSVSKCLEVRLQQIIGYDYCRSLGSEPTIS